MKNWNHRLKKLETETFKMSKDEMLNEWVENQTLPLGWTYVSIHSQVPKYLKGECAKKILVEFHNYD